MRTEIGAREYAGGQKEGLEGEGEGNKLLRTSSRRIDLTRGRCSTLDPSIHPSDLSARVSMSTSFIHVPIHLEVVCRLVRGIMEFQSLATPRCSIFLTVWRLSVTFHKYRIMRTLKMKCLSPSSECRPLTLRYSRINF